MAELLVIPLKKSSDVDLVKPLKNLIQSTYNSGETEDYSDALNELSRLRTNAIWKVFEKSSLDVLYSYYDQLVLLESKVPPHEVQVPFKWKDAFDKGSIFGGRMSLTISSMAYERVCVLFNIGALQSAGAAAEPLETEDSMKAAAKLLQQAAGVFAHLRANVPAAVHRDTTPDLSPDALDALHKLMLAQAQEVIAYKCMRDDVKDSMTAKVMSAAEEMYADAARALQRDAVKPLWERDWLPTAQGKQAAFRGLAQLYQAAVCRAAQRPGEEIARLQLAVELLKGAAEPTWEAAARAQRQLTQATKDNDFIYHERIPERAQLEPVPRAPVAKALPLPRTYTEPKDLFVGLVPLSVRGALGATEARRADAVAQLVGTLRESTQLLNSILASLNLPACLEEGSSAEGGLPDSIASKARAVRDAGGAAELARLMQELPDLLQRNRDILNEAERMVREEEQADDSLRQQFGARWTRTASRALTEGFRANGDKYRQIIDNAVRADNIVRDKYNTHREGIELLSKSPEELESGVPRAPQAAGGAPAARRALLELMREVEALKGERDALETELKDVRVDLREEFLRAAEAGAVDEAALSAGALGAALAPLRARADASLARQEALAARLQAEHAALDAGAAPAGGPRAERDAALRRLAAAHDAYQELTGNLTEGVKFYNDLTQLLVAYQNKVSDFCFARRTEKEELLKDLTQDASRPAPAPPAAPAPEPTATARREPPARPPPPAAPAAAALPYPTQPQGMPLPYGAPGVGPVGYYAAPMPALYNPYATLPYPHHVRHAPPPQPYQPYQYPAPAPAPYAPPPPGYNPYPQ